MSQNKISSILDQLREQSQMVVDKVYGMKGGPLIVTYTAPWVCCYLGIIKLYNIKYVLTLHCVSGMQSRISVAFNASKGVSDEALTYYYSYIN